MSDEYEYKAPQGSDIWLKIAREAYETSTTFVDNNYRKKWQDNLRHFNNQHHSDSKYYKSSYQYRSKIFRPKTRSALRNNEAAAVAAFFSNQDVVTISAMNPRDRMQVASADVMQELLQYRLSKTIPWFLILVGGFQDAMVQGVVASYQHWQFEPAAMQMPSSMDVLNMSPQGTYTIGMQPQQKPKVDRPWIEIIPIENVRIHPSANWAQPIQSSPYVIQLVPMFVMDVRKRMQEPDQKTGNPQWFYYSDDEMRSAQKQNFDTTRLARESMEDRMDQAQHTKELSIYDVVWVHRNFMKHDGDVIVYYTLGTQHLLSEPMLLRDVYFHDEIPIVMGTCIVETHKLMSSGLVELGSNVQKEINENVNQRADNVKLVLNKRHIVKRGAQVDITSLVRNVPGSVTLAGNPQTDVVPLEWNDITGSAYQEQDRLNLDFDELVGTFSASSIQSNRKMNETVGGMSMLRTGVNSLIEYVIRTFAETWVEPVLRQMVKLEQAYETDEVVLSIAAEKAELFQKYGFNGDLDSLLDHELTVTVNVGMGATDPMTRVQFFKLGLDSIVAAAASPAAQLFDIQEIAKEIWGRIGYKDGIRFLNKQLLETWAKQDPEKEQMKVVIQQLTQMIRELQGQVKSKQMEVQAKLQDNAAERENKLALATLKEDEANRRKAADVTIQTMESRNRPSGAENREKWTK